MVRTGGYGRGAGACWRGPPQNEKKLEGGWGGGRSASPPMHSLQGMHCRW